MESNEMRTHTARGKVVARFTMVAIFKPQYTKPGTEGRFTFRADKVREYYTKFKQLDFDSDIAALRHKYSEILHRCLEIAIYDNSLPKLENCICRVVNGKVIYSINYKNKAA